MTLEPGKEILGFRRTKTMKFLGKILKILIPITPNQRLICRTLAIRKQEEKSLYMHSKLQFVKKENIFQVILNLFKRQNNLSTTVNKLKKEATKRKTPKKAITMMGNNQKACLKHQMMKFD